MKKQIVAYSNVQCTDNGILICETCGRRIPNTANNEMRKEGVFAHSHLCCKYNDGTIKIVFEEGYEVKP